MAGYAHTGQELKGARQLAGLKQREVGEQVGASARTVIRWEREGIPDGAHQLAAVRQLLDLGGSATRRVFLDEATDAEFLAENARRLARSRPVAPSKMRGRWEWYDEDAEQATGAPSRSDADPPQFGRP